MSTFRQALDSNALTPTSTGPAVGAAPVGPAALVHSNRVDPESLGFRLSEKDAQGIDEPHNLALMAAAREGATSMRGPIYLFVRRPETAIARNKREKLRQQNIKEACNKKA
ncbi:hypothetical protein HN51_038404, partial [Arachis hypogaea]